MYLFIYFLFENLVGIAFDKLDFSTKHERESFIKQNSTMMVRDETVKSGKKKKSGWKKVILTKLQYDMMLEERKDELPPSFDITLDSRKDADVAEKTKTIKGKKKNKNSKKVHPHALVT